MAHLLIRKKNQKRQRHVEVGHLPLTIGRAPTNALILPGADVSRSHCVIEPTGAGVKILDVGSRHGLRVNHELQTETYLRHGDRIQVGTYELVYLERLDADQVSDSPAESGEPGNMQDTIVEGMVVVDPTLDALRDELDRFRRAGSSQDQSFEVKIAELTTRTRQLEEERDELRRRAESAEQDLARTIDRIHAEAGAPTDPATAALAPTDDATGSADERLVRLERNCRTANQQIAALEVCLETACRAEQDAITRAAEVEAARIEITKRLDAVAHADLPAITAERDALRSELATLEARVQTLDHDDHAPPDAGGPDRGAELERLLAQRDALRARLERAEVEGNEQRAELKTALAARDVALADAQRALTNASADAERVRGELAQLEAHVRTLDAERADAGVDAGTLSESDAAERERLLAQRDAFRTRLTRAEAESAEQRAEIEATLTTREAALADARRALADASEDADALRSEIASLQQSGEAVEPLREALATARQERDALAEKLQEISDAPAPEATAALGQTSDYVARLEADVERLLAQRDGLRARLDRADGEVGGVADLHADRDRLQRELETMTLDVAAQRTAFEQTRAELVAARNAADERLSETLQAAEIRRDTDDAARTEIETYAAEVVTERDRLRSEVERLRNEVAAADECVKRLEHETTERDALAAEAERRIVALEQEHGEQAQAGASAEDRIAQIERERDQALAEARERIALLESERRTDETSTDDRAAQLERELAEVAARADAAQARVAEQDELVATAEQIMAHVEQERDAALAQARERDAAFDRERQEIAAESEQRIARLEHDLETALAATEERVTQLEAERDAALADAEDRISTLTREHQAGITTAGDRTAQVERELADASARLVELERERDAAHTQAEERLAALDRERETGAAATDERTTQLERELAEAQERIARLEAERDAARSDTGNRIADLERENLHQRAAITEAKFGRSDDPQSTERLEAAFASLLARNKALETEVHVLSEGAMRADDSDEPRPTASAERDLGAADTSVVPSLLRSNEDHYPADRDYGTLIVVGILCLIALGAAAVLIWFSFQDKAIFDF